MKRLLLAVLFFAGVFAFSVKCPEMGEVKPLESGEKINQPRTPEEAEELRKRVEESKDEYNEKTEVVSTMREKLKSLKDKVSIKRIKSSIASNEKFIKVFDSARKMLDKPSVQDLLKRYSADLSAERKSAVTPSVKAMDLLALKIPDENPTNKQLITYAKQLNDILNTPLATHMEKAIGKEPSGGEGLDKYMRAKQEFLEKHEAELNKNMKFLTDHYGRLHSASKGITDSLSLKMKLENSLLMVHLDREVNLKNLALKLIEGDTAVLEKENASLQDVKLASPSTIQTIHVMQGRIARDVNNMAKSQALLDKFTAAVDKSMKDESDLESIKNQDELDDMRDSNNKLIIRIEKIQKARLDTDRFQKELQGLDELRDHIDIFMDEPNLGKDVHSKLKKAYGQIVDNAGLEHTVLKKYQEQHSKLGDLLTKLKAIDAKLSAKEKAGFAKGLPVPAMT